MTVFDKRTLQLSDPNTFHMVQLRLLITNNMPDRLNQNEPN